MNQSTNTLSVMPNASPTSNPGLTAAQVSQATETLHGITLNLLCSDQACHLGANEFELVQTDPIEPKSHFYA